MTVRAPVDELDLKEALDRVLAEGTPAVRELARRQAAECLAALLQVDITELVISAWQTSDELLEAAAATRREPGARVVVEAARQHYTAHRDATLDITVDGHKVKELPVRLEIGLELRGLTAALRNGCVTEIGSGAGTMTASLHLDEVALPGTRRDFDLRLSLNVRPPIALYPRSE